jgi:hypothetical protein
MREILRPRILEAVEEKFLLDGQRGFLQLGSSFCSLMRDMFNLAAAGRNQAPWTVWKAYGTACEGATPQEFAAPQCTRASCN